MAWRNIGRPICYAMGDFTMRSRLALSVAAAMLSAPAFAGDPVAETCALAATLPQGIEAIMTQLETMAALWGDEGRARLGPLMRPELAKFKMEAGKVWTIGDLDPFMRELLVVSADREQGTTLYFRIIYEAAPDGLYFKNVRFNSDFYEISKDPQLQPPAPVACG